MKPEEVPAEWLAAAEAVLVPGKPLNMADLRRAIASVAPLIQARDRDRCIAAFDDAEPSDGNHYLTLSDYIAAIKALR
jgi:hypothetical protein